MASSWKLEASSTTSPSGGTSRACSAEGRADVPGHQHRTGLTPQQLAGEGGGRGLAVGAGDRQRVRLHDSPGQLELAHDGHPPRPRPGQGGQVEGHPRAHHDQAGAGERGGGMPARPERAALAGEGPGVRRERVERARVGREHPAAEPPDQPGRGDPAPARGRPRRPSAQRATGGTPPRAGPAPSSPPPPRRRSRAEPSSPHLARTLPFPSATGNPPRRHRSLRVVRARSASMKERIQKRTMIFGSAQP